MKSNDSPSHVLVVSHPAVIGVNQLVYAEVADRGWKVDLVVPARWRHDYSSAPFRPEILPRLADSSRTLPIALAGRPQRHFYLANPLRVLRSATPDVLFVEQEPSSLAAFQWGTAAKLSGVPFGIQIDENLDRAFPAPVRRLRSWVLKNAAFVVARSPTASQLAQQWGALGDVHLVPHHVPAWDGRNRIKSDTFRVGFAGRLVPEKGLPVLVDAVRRLNGPLELVVAGDGPLRTWLEDQHLGDATLRLMTGIPHARMQDAYAHMDVLVLPSRATSVWVEQFGRVLVEALCCGVPVVGSATGEIPWVIEATGGGRVFPDGDAFALAAILDRLRADAPLRTQYASNGEAAARARFSVDAVASELVPVLERAAATRPATSTSRDARPRVLLVAHGIHDGGGMERSCAELVRRTHLDIRYTIVAANLAPELERLVDRWVRIRVPPRPIPLKFICFFVLGGLAVYRANTDLVHAIGAIIPNRVDIVGVHFCHAGARRAQGLTPTEGTLARRANTAAARGLACIAEAWCYRSRRVRIFTAVSAGVAAELHAHYPGIPLLTVPNGVDAERFQPDALTRARQRRAEAMKDTDVVALFVGSEWARKGLAVAIDAVRLVRQTGTPLWLWVVGSGDDGVFSEAPQASNGAPWVRFFGRQTETERFYQAADLFLLPSQYETFSLVSYEAAACGLPIVGTAVSGVTDLIGANEGGILVSRDAATVSSALLSLANDEELRSIVGATARLRAVAYTWDNSASGMLQAYQSLLCERQGSPAE